MKKYLEHLDESITGSKLFSNYISENKTKLNYNRIINELDDHYDISIPDYINTIKFINDLSITHYTSIDKVIEFIKQNKITAKENDEVLNEEFFDKDQYIQCFLGRDLWLNGLCEIQFKDSILNEDYYFLSKSHHEYETIDHILEHLMDIKDLKTFIVDYYLKKPNGTHLLVNNDNVYQRANVYIPKEISFNHVKTIKCASIKVKEYILEELKEFPDIQFVKNLLTVNEEPCGEKFKNTLHIIGIDNEFESKPFYYIYLYHKEYVYIFVKKLNDYVKVGTFNECIKQLTFKRYHNLIYLADLFISKDADFNIELLGYGKNDTVLFPIFHKLKNTEISDTCLKFYIDYIIKFNHSSPNDIRNYHKALNDGLLRKQVERVIVGDELNYLRRLDEILLVGFRISKTKFLVDYLEELYISDSIDKNNQMFYCFRRIFNLERYGLITLSEEKKDEKVKCDRCRV